MVKYGQEVYQVAHASMRGTSSESVWRKVDVISVLLPVLLVKGWMIMDRRDPA